jgi:DNA-binding SARP family transcriptional activator/tetratricopeptide (TPR) repeat protein
VLRVRVLGDLRVELDGTAAALPSSAKVRAVLAWLALHPGLQPRSSVAARLWPDVLDASARASLRSAIWALRRAFGDDDGRLLVATREQVGLGGPGVDVWVDLLEFDRLARAGRPEDALALDRGSELLAGIDEEWVYAARDEHRDRLMAALAAAADAAEAAGDLAAATAHDRRRAQLDPLSEPAHRDLIRRLDAAGDRGAALAAYARLRDRMRRELSLSPSAATRAVVEAVRASADAEEHAAASAAAAAEAAKRARAVGGSVPAARVETWARRGAVDGWGLRGVDGSGLGDVDPSGLGGVDASTGADGQDETLHPRAERPRATPVADRVRVMPPLAGRDDERAVLLDAWRRAREGDGGAVLLEGEGGIGKSRLALELLAHAEHDGATVAGCAGLELGGAAPFGLWAELLGELGRTIAPAAPDASEVWPEDVGRLAPSVARRLSRTPPAATAASPDFERARLFEAVAEMLAWAATQRPLVLLVEDIHLADVASLELAAYVARRLPELPALLVLTRRDAPRRPDADLLRQALARRGALHAELELGPLPPAALAALVRSVARLADDEVGRVVEASEGNALLAVESARAGGAGAQPQGLRALVRGATARLAPEARLVAELTAVAGRELTRDEVLALPVDRPAAAAALDSGLLAARDGRLGFRHALLRAAAYDDVPEPRRAELHDQLAGALEAAGRAPAAELARHLRLAGRDEVAVAHLERAGLEARGMGALVQAAAFLGEALEIRPGDPTLLLELGDVEAWRSRWEATDEAFERALAGLAPDDAIGRARAYARRGLWFRTSLCAPARSAAAYREALELLDAPAGVGDPNEPAAVSARGDARTLLIDVLAGLAWAEGAGGDPDETDVLLARVHALTGGRLPDAIAATVNSARGMALCRRGRFTESYGPMVAAADAHLRAGAVDEAWVALSNAACAAAFERDFERALAYAERAARLGGGRAVGLAVHVHAAHAYVLSRLGRHAEARAAAEEQRARAERAESPTLLATAQHDLGQVALAAGDYATAAEALGAALEAGAAVPRAQARLARAEALTRLHRTGEAQAELRAATLEPVTPSDFPATLVPRLTRVQALIAAARGDRATAVALLREAADGWRRQLAAGAPAAYRVDMGRPPVAGLVELDRQLEQIERDLAALDTVPA